MQIKKNEHGIYFFFPTGPEELQRSADEVAKIAGMLAFNATWDIYSVIWPALMEITEKARAEKKEKEDTASE